MRRYLPAVAALFVFTSLAVAQPPMALKQEADRVAVIARVKPTVVAVFARGGQGGGTGVLISDDGYALTNFHVVAPTGPTMQCGLADGVLYDGVLVGWDKIGDVALIKLLPKKQGQKFPFSQMGNSDLVREGDWSIAMGNPFLLATDFTPTVTFGLVSGVHRYQPPAGSGLLEYTDCIQIDTSINPGNSGGPLFNLKGEVIGINGRGSFDKRGRINSGVGYAISINQIKNFMGHLRAGLDSDHASLGALVRTEAEGFGIGKTNVTTILDEADAARRGLQVDDQIVSFADRLISSDNHYKNVVGIFPRGWRVPLVYSRGDTRKEILVRLMGAQRKEIPDTTKPKVDPKPPKGLPGKKGPQGPAAKFYVARAGFANYYFNKLEKENLLAAFKKNGDFSTVGGDWKLEGKIRLLKANFPSDFVAEIKDIKVGASEKPTVILKIGAFADTLDIFPGDKEVEISKRRMPKGSGGFMPALYVWKHFLTKGEVGLSECIRGGTEPFYPPPTDNSVPKEWAKQRVDTEVITSTMGNYKTKWFYAKTDQKLLGFELRMQEYNEDPCEVYFSDYRAVSGRQLPHRMQVYYEGVHYGTFTITSYNLK
ncbi:MAG: trypsin-like peptidase domain-containing protein [Planctomycetes bacterium]|nr:trypsin-like peptidase domain-containing protein [Planctomycetota bacterium]